MCESDEWNHTSMKDQADLVTMLSMLPRYKVPPDFAMLATRRFEQALAARQHKRLGLLTMAVFVYTSTMMWMLVLNTGGTLDALKAAFSAAAGFIETVMTIWRNIPGYGAFFGAAVTMMCLFLAGLIGKMDQAPSRVK